MTAIAQRRLTESEYLAAERASTERKCEFVNGEVYAMTGASYPHNVLTANLMVTIGARLRGAPCRVVGQDLRTRVDRTRLYTYPDVLIVCGQPQFIDGERDTLINPSTIFEVLSPSTESWDRGGKFQHYQRIETLREYVLLSQTAVRLEIYRRSERGSWVYELIEGRTENLHLEPCLEMAALDLPLREIYDGLNFDGVAEPAPMARQ